MSNIFPTFLVLFQECVGCDPLQKCLPISLPSWLNSQVQTVERYSCEQRTWQSLHGIISWEVTEAIQERYRTCLQNRMYDYTPREDYFPKMVNGQIEVGMTLSEVQVVISCTYPRKLKGDPNSRLILEGIQALISSLNIILCEFGKCL